MKKVLTVFSFCLFFSGIALSQSPFKSAIGGRVGNPLAFSYKVFISDYGALEGLAGFNPYTIYGLDSFVGGMYLHHFDIEPVENLQWYIGGGANVHVWAYNDIYGIDDNPTLAFSVAPCGGASYTFDFPLNVSVDWYPRIYLNGINDVFGWSGFSAAARYVLK